MQEIKLSAFIRMAEELAADWRRIVTTANEERGKKDSGSRKAAINPELCTQLRITSAMRVLNRYYTVLPD